MIVTIQKNKIELNSGINLDLLFEKLQERYNKHNLNLEDGLKIDLEDGWIHLRKSNTEPIVRIYTEGTSKIASENLALKIKSDIGEIMKAHA